MTKQIVKQNGEVEDFDPEKLKESLLRAHTSIITANEIVDTVTKKIKNGATTTAIYKHAFSLLKKKEKKSAAMYSIRRSILDFGPSGFPFEQYVAEILRAKGYKVEVGVTLKGKCVDHEMDIVAFKGEDLFFVEVKFHNQLNFKSDTKVALYVKARYDDLKDEIFTFEGKERKMTKGLIITNTKFTNNAIKYAECIGFLDLISWSYPRQGNLYDLISETSLQPTTSVELLTKKQQRLLAEKGIVNCQDLKQNKAMLKEVGLNDTKINKIEQEIDMICKI